MISVWPSTIRSLNDSLAVLNGSVEQLKAAKSVQIAEVAEQFKTAAESAQGLRTLIWSELPKASWQNREELDALLEEIQKRVEARASEQLRSRLLSLATELERGRIVHHRASRVNRLNQLREQAIEELHAQAGLEGVPQTLSGPEAERWIEWACRLQEPEDAESLQTLRNRFPRLDEFVANLEGDMWVAGRPPTSEILTEAERPADKTNREQSRPATKSDMLAPNSVTPPRAEEQVRPMRAPKRELPASAMSIVTDRIHHFNHPAEPPYAAEASSESSAAPAITTDPFEALFTKVVLRQQSATTETTSHTRARVGELWRGQRRMLLLVAAVVLLIAALGAIPWRWHRKHNSSSPVKAAETKVPLLAQSNPADKGYSQSAMSSDSGTPTSPKLETETESKPKKEESVTPKRLSMALPEKQASKPDDAALRTPEAIPKEAAVVRMEEAPPGAATGVSGSVPGGLTSKVPNSVMNVVRDVSVAKPDIPAQKVRISSGVAQGLLIHQVPPLYPALARRAHIQGTVVLQAVIGKDGSVQSVHALSGHSLLVPAAVAAVRQWRYKPFYLNGQPTEAAIQINVNFTPSGE